MGYRLIVYVLWRRHFEFFCFYFHEWVSDLDEWTDESSWELFWANWSNWAEYFLHWSALIAFWCVWLKRICNAHCYLKMIRICVILRLTYKNVWQPWHIIKEYKKYKQFRPKYSSLIFQKERSNYYFKSSIITDVLIMKMQTETDWGLGAIL